MKKLIICNSVMYGLWNAPKNKFVVKMFIMIMFAYSSIKNRVNDPTVYFMLKHNMSSDPPSVKSNWSLPG